MIDIKDYFSPYNEEIFSGEIREIRQKHRLINEELSKYSWKTIRKFNNMFPCEIRTSATTMEITSKEYVDEQSIISNIITKNNSFVTSYYDTEYIYLTSPEDFWYRWNKFKKLRIFF